MHCELKTIKTTNVAMLRCNIMKKGFSSENPGHFRAIKSNTMNKHI